MNLNVLEVVLAGGDFQSWLKFFLSSLLLIVSIPSLKSVLFKTEKRQRFESVINKFPGPSPLPLIGNAHQCLRVVFRSETEYFGLMTNMVNKFGPVFRLWKFGTPNIVIASGDVAIKLLKEGVIDDKCEDLKNFAVAIGGIGLISYPPEAQARSKKFWNPFFNRRQIESSMQFMEAEGLKLVNELEQFVGCGSTLEPKVFDLLNYAIRCTFNIVCCSAMGQDFMNAMSDDVANQHKRDLHTIGLNITRRVFRPWLSHDTIYYNTPGGRETKRCAERGANFVKEAIAFRRKVRSSRNQTTGETDESSYFLDILLDLHEQGILDEAQVMGELNVFIAAGYDTTGIVLSLVIFYLALYPEHQEKVVQELQQVLGPDFGSNENYSLTWDTLKGLKHLELCIKESLRLHPLVPTFPRRTTQDVKLEDGRVIPRDVDVFIQNYIIHRDPKHFEDPDEFKPERHSGALNPTFMPFSFGNRSCIGQVYGMITVKTVVAHLLINYIWETTETREGLKTLFQTVQVPISMKFKIRKRTV